jgi:hypothetical protein
MAVQAAASRASERVLFSLSLRHALSAQQRAGEFRANLAYRC